MTSSVIVSIRNEFLRYRTLADGAMAQLSDGQLTHANAEGGNSIAVICQHVSGNLRSRFTDFLVSDGEKPWRRREAEFDAPPMTREQWEADWTSAWQVLFSALAGLTDADLSNTVTIRQQPLTVVEALHRSLAHVSYHVGQIVYVAKDLRGADWTSLSIPRGQSDAYNRAPTRERAGATPPGPEGRP